MRRALLAAAVLAGALVLWIAYDLARSRTHDLREFDGHEVARLETAMWRSYYDHRQIRLFAELSELLRRQFDLPFWQSCAGAYHAARAAVVFQRGRSHADYRLALPDLNRYYALIRRSSTTPFAADRAASLELEWWIVHRERNQHSPADLYAALARLQAELYRLPEGLFAEHARTRGDAMLLRDAAAAQRGAPSEADWRNIGTLLDRSWMSLEEVVASR